MTSRLALLLTVIACGASGQLAEFWAHSLHQAAATA